MPRQAMRVCPRPGCPELTPGGPCPAHRAETQRRRPSRQARGYGKDHTRLRAQWKRKVDLGTETCARCGLPILPGDPWALDHTDDRTGYLGPSHQRCNDSAGGKARHR